MKNLIYIPASGGILSALPYGLSSWQIYSKRVNADLLVSKSHLEDSKEMEGSGAWEPWMGET